MTRLLSLALFATLCLSAYAQRVTDGQLVLYDFGAVSGRSVLDVSGNVPPVHLSVRSLPGKRFTPGAVPRRRGATLDGSVFLLSSSSADSALRQCRNSGEVSVEMWMQPLTDGTQWKSTLIEIGDDSGGSDFRISDVGQEIEMVLRAPDSSAEECRLAIPSIARLGATHMVFTCAADGHARVYIDGRQKGLPQSAPAGAFAGRNFPRRLRIGASPSDDAPWKGIVYLAAVYSKALTAEEVVRNYRDGMRYITPEYLQGSYDSAACGTPGPLARNVLTCRK